MIKSEVPKIELFQRSSDALRSEAQVEENGIANI